MTQHKTTATPGQERRAEALTTSAPKASNQHDPGRVTGGLCLNCGGSRTGCCVRESAARGQLVSAAEHYRQLWLDAVAAHRRMFGWFLFAWVQAVVAVGVSTWALTR